MAYGEPKVREDGTIIYKHFPECPAHNAPKWQDVLKCGPCDYITQNRLICTLCEHPVDEYPLWGIDYPNSGPVHDECGRYDDWHYFTDTKDVRLARYIREQGWLPTPCAVPIY